MVNGAAKPAYEWDRTGEEERVKRMPFPTPRNTNLTFPELCEYYNALREMPVGRYSRLYVQRWWPVLLPVEAEDVFGNVKDSFPNDVKIEPKDGPLSQQLLLSMAGVGEYKFRLNDSRRPWKQQTIVFSEFDIVDPTLWTIHPPNILPERIDLEAKRNATYIKFARNHGYLPREGAEEKEQIDMANVAAIDSVLEDSRRERARADEIQRQQVERAEREAKEAKEAAAKATATQSKPIESPRPTTDLEAMGGVIVSLVNAVKPNPDTSLTEYLKLEAKREETRRETEKAEREAAREAAKTERERADKLQAEILNDLRTKVTASVAVTAPPTEVEILEREVKKKALLKQLYGNAATPDEEARPSNIDKWLEAAPIIAPIFQSIVGGIFQAVNFGLQTWQQVSYNNALGKNGDPKPPTVVNAQPEPGKPMPPQQPTLTPEQQAQQQRLGVMLAALESACEPISNALDDGESGFTFAESVIKWKRRPAYDMIRSLGLKPDGEYDFDVFKQNVGNLMQHPGRGPQTAKLWEKVAPLSTFGAFLKDFFDYDEIREQLETEKDAQ